MDEETFREHEHRDVVEELAFCEIVSRKDVNNDFKVSSAASAGELENSVLADRSGGYLVNLSWCCEQMKKGLTHLLPILGVSCGPCSM